MHRTGVAEIWVSLFHWMAHKVAPLVRTVFFQDGSVSVARRSNRQPQD